MAIGLIMSFGGVDAAKYDAVMQDLGLTSSRGDWPKGLLSHTAGRTQSGWCVVDVWESQADMEAFRGRLGAAFGKVGGIPEPQITPIEVHNTFRRGSA